MGSDVCVRPVSHANVHPKIKDLASTGTAALPLAHPQTTNRKSRANRARHVGIMWEAGETDEEWLTFSRRELGLVELDAGESSVTRPGLAPGLSLPRHCQFLTVTKSDFWVSAFYVGLCAADFA